MSTVGCPYCSSTDVSVEAITLDDAESKASYSAEHYRCAYCGETFSTFEQSQAEQRAYSEAVARAYRGHSGSEILQIRARYALSQEDFEKALGVGKKTVGRWERGTVPPGAAARGLLWIADQHPQVFIALAQRNGVDVDAHASVPFFATVRATAPFSSAANIVAFEFPEDLRSGVWQTARDDEKVLEMAR